MGLQAARALGYVNRRYTGQYKGEVMALEVLRQDFKGKLSSEIMTLQV